jgi:ferrous iron transport protein B
MEMHSFKVPSLSVVLKQTWARTKSIIYTVFPIYIVGSALVQVLFSIGALDPLSIALSPLTVSWLGLPIVAGTLLVLGVIRKEFIILGAVSIFGTTNLAAFLSPVQLITLALVGILYLPCLSTIAILAKDFNWKTAIYMSLANLGAAILVGGITYRILSLFI